MHTADARPPIVFFIGTSFVKSFNIQMPETFVAVVLKIEDHSTRNLLLLIEGGIVRAGLLAVYEPDRSVSLTHMKDLRKRPPLFVGNEKVSIAKLTKALTVVTKKDSGGIKSIYIR
jgi:hypothetical protein